MDVRRRRDLTALFVSEVKPDAATPPKVKRAKRPKTIPKTMAAALADENEKNEKRAERQRMKSLYFRKSFGP